MSNPRRKATTILLADDEPYNLEWLVDYIESKKYQVDFVYSVDQAFSALEESLYRVVVADLSIPAIDAQAFLVGRDPLIQRYPGLAIAEHARNRGHTDRQVIVYSVHDDPAVESYANRLRCTYLLKGRPRRFKDELDVVLSYDPLAPNQSS